MESDAEAETVREVYERAIANVPPIQEKRHWKRYIYLWINYALYEELEAKVKNWILCQLLMPCPYSFLWIVTDSLQSLKQKFGFDFL